MLLARQSIELALVPSASGVGEHGAQPLDDQRLGRRAEEHVADVVRGAGAIRLQPIILIRSVCEVVRGGEEGGVGPAGHKGKWLAQNERVDVGNHQLKPAAEHRLDERNLGRSEGVELPRTPSPLGAAELRV